MADSTIRVNIIGDARKLQGALKESEAKIGGFSKAAVIAGGTFAAAFAADKVIDFANAATTESDRVGDALTRLEAQLTGPLATAIDERADDFANLGASRQDILELSASFADTATALGQGKDDIATWATDAAAIASALALQGVGEPDQLIEDIGKAAAGSERALRNLGINLSDAEVEARALQDSGKDTPALLTDSELAGARYAIVLERLAERAGDLTAANGDLEQSQAEAQARFETAMGRIGAALEGPLNDLLIWISEGIEGWFLFADEMGKVGKAINALGGPIGVISEVIGGLIDDLARALGLAGDLNSTHIEGPTTFAPGGQFNPTSSAAPVTVNIQSADTDMIEQTVQKALKSYQGANGFSYPDHL